VVWQFFDRHNITFKTSHASEQERPDVAAKHEAWKASQPEINIQCSSTRPELRPKVALYKAT
jgi:hypothetical protein